jgi:mRNA interferase HigB
VSITKHADWLKALDVLEDFPDADLVKNTRVVFSIAETSTD